MTIQDWGITYDELEPYYDRFEYMAGIAGKAGNINGQLIAGGNVFEGPRSREYPVRAQDDRAQFDVPEGCERPWLSPVPRPVREPSRAVQEPGRSHARPVHVLRVLRAFRLRGGRQGRSDRDRDPTGAQDREVRDPRVLARVRDQERRQVGPERPLLRRIRSRPGTAGRRHHPRRVRLQQRAHAAHVEARKAVRPREGGRSRRYATTATRRAAAGRVVGSPASGSSATWARARWRWRSTTSTPTTSTTRVSASSAAARSRPGRPARGRSRA